jgi:hypothetical protein
MKMERTECSETLAFKLQMPGNNPEESIDIYIYIYTHIYIYIYINNILYIVSTPTCFNAHASFFAYVNILT